ncbi:DUF4012 domain-containing protein [Microbacterium saperdae]|uniref:Uncharacterized protein DUF4012 n=1 Tax=Microbacterium saperdae TaxID=69368 RepID=A0A543BQN6_9MICO|nr:DUF4012 domain-containing protein [Microbacterium saperdae]TQL87133.1 uncharacterized protein DUF4012 [Microbacterium saperdae]GGM42639.1 hypothetical protein GCM10010489_12160 [Microbacterium saperdae]
MAVVVVALGVGGAFVGKRVYDQAMTARAHLTAAMPYVNQVKSALLASDVDAAGQAAQAYVKEASAAQAALDGRAWSALEQIPLPVFENLRAVHTVADVAEEVGTQILVPASSMTLASIAPSGGRVDVAGLSTIQSTVAEIGEAVDGIEGQLDAIDRVALIEQVGTGVKQVDDAVGQVRALVGPAQDILGILPGLLGADGPRNYLLMFQGNAEARASGGSPGSFVVLRADQGAITFEKDVAATEFPFAIPESVVPLDAETTALYSDIVGRWTANMTSTPDFPTTAALLQGWWATQFDDQIDGVVSVDPVALSYFLEATGPLTLATGDVLTSENAAALLMNEAYFIYPDGRDSNAFFAGAAVSVFNGLLAGGASPVKLIDAGSKAAVEGRLKVWVPDADAMAVIDGSPVAGTLPIDNDEETAIGVYFNDTTGSKMDYYVDAAVAVETDQCTALGAPSWTTSVTLQNGITRDKANTLPRYITGPYFTPGDIGTDYIVYAPVGATIESWTVNGEARDALAHTTHLGRDAIRVNIVLKPGESATLQVLMKGAEAAKGASYGPLTVKHTPMVRETSVDIAAKGCS